MAFSYDLNLQNIYTLGRYQTNEAEVFFMGGGNEPSRGKKSEEAVT